MSNLFLYLIWLDFFLRSETDILRQARSAASTILGTSVRKQRPATPSFNYGDLVRITKGEYKDEIGKRFLSVLLNIGSFKKTVLI